MLREIQAGNQSVRREGRQSGKDKRESERDKGKQEEREAVREG